MGVSYERGTPAGLEGGRNDGNASRASAGGDAPTSSFKCIVELNTIPEKVSLGMQPRVGWGYNPVQDGHSDFTRGSVPRVSVKGAPDEVSGGYLCEGST